MKNKGFTLVEVVICLMIIMITGILIVNVLGVFMSIPDNNSKIEIREQFDPNQKIQETPIETKGEHKKL